MQVVQLKLERINQVLPWPVRSEEARLRFKRSIEKGELGPVTVLESVAEEQPEPELQIV
jgi:hypothetical protein